MYIVITGAVQLLDGATVIKECTESMTFGERSFLESSGLRALSARVTVPDTHVLVLTKADFLDKTFYFEHTQKVSRMNYI